MHDGMMRLVFLGWILLSIFVERDTVRGSWLRCSFARIQLL